LLIIGQPTVLFINIYIVQEIYLQFDGISELITIIVEPQPNAKFFWDNLSRMHRPADSIQYNKSPAESLHNFLVLANKANQVLNFDWDLSQLTQESFNKWHRDIELLDPSQQPSWTQDQDHFFIDLHNALHEAEPNNPGRFVKNRTFIQVKWYDSSLAWPEEPTHECVLRRGDVTVDYPHVGKSPWISMLHGDNQKLQQSCRLADACAPGFFIFLEGVNELEFEKINNQQRSQQHSRLLEWYQANRDQLESLFSSEQMLSYYGNVRVGKVKDLSQLELLKKASFRTMRLL